MVARLKPFADRKAAADSAQALIGRTFGAASQIRQANVLAFNLPPIIGLSTSGGFEYQLEALEGQDPAAMGSVAGGLIGVANRDPRLRGGLSRPSRRPIRRSISTSTGPRRRRSGLNISDVFTALQATLGGVYVNNFNLYGRTWQVNVQGEASDRADIRTSGGFTYATASARWCRSAPSPGLKIVTDTGHHPLNQLPLGLRWNAARHRASLRDGARRHDRDFQ